MITVSADYHPAQMAPCPGAKTVIAQPNQSANWETNKQLIIGFGLFSGLVATGFSLIGAWMILPFAGLEITALGSALFIVCRRLNIRHVLYFSGDELFIEKGAKHPEQAWRLLKSDTQLIVERGNHSWDPLQISLYNSQSGEIAIGDFLNQDDSKELLAALKVQGLRVRSDSHWGELTL